MAKAKVKTSTLLEAEVNERVRFCAEVMASSKVILQQVEMYEDGTQAVIVRIYFNKEK